MPKAGRSVSPDAICGVYVLFRNKEVLYIGRSADCHQRVKEHRTKGREFDYALVAPCPKADVAWIEAALVLAFQSPQNKQFRTPKPAKPEVVTVYVPEDGLEMLNKGRARAMAYDYRLHREFDAALASGELKMIDKAQPGAARRRPFITKAELRAWLNAKQAVALQAAE